MHIALLSYVLRPVGGGGAPFVPALKAYPRLEYMVNGVWTDITARWRSDEPMICEYGIQGSDPAIDHIADTGTLSFVLDDGARSGTYGLTAPFSPNRITGWNLGCPIRWSLGQSPGTRYYKFNGSLADVTPDPGISRKSERRSRCTAVDMWDTFAEMSMPPLAALIGYRSDSLLAQLLDALPIAVNQRVLDVGVETFPFGFDGGSGQGLMVREAIQQIVISEFGYAYRKGDTLNGDTFVFENRAHRVNAPTFPLAALTDADIVAMDATASRDDVCRTVRVRIHPMRVDTSPVVVYELKDSFTTIANGETMTILGGYRNPESEDQPIGAIDGVQPVPITAANPNGDYSMNVARDGSGGDLTLGFSVIAYFAGDNVKFQIHNASGSAAFITKLQARAKGLYRGDAVIEGTVVTAPNYKTLDIDMPLQTSIDTAEAVTALVVANYSQAVAMVRSVTFVATRTQALFDAAMQREPGDRISITEGVTGFNASVFTINSVRYEVNQAGVLWCTWGLEPDLHG